MANPEHLKILKQGVEAWNKWREENPEVKPELPFVDIAGSNLEGINLEGAMLNGANLQGAFLDRANFQGAKLCMTKLQGAHLVGSNFQKAEVYWSFIQAADLRLSNLRKANFSFSNLQAANFTGTLLQGANFSYVIVDGETAIVRAQVDRNTNFEGVGLDSMRIDPGIKQLLEYNIRRKNWKQWYKEHKFLKCIVKEFWRISDYGLSTKTIIVKFFKWATIFALVYLFFDYSTQDGIVNNLSQVNGQQVPWWLVPIRAFYFSVVTMTTLGFGDMYAKFNSLLGHLLLTIQVLLGYVFLGALVTRFAVLFTVGGPAARFTELKEES